MQSINQPEVQHEPASVLAEYLSRKQLATQLGVTTRTLQNWAWLRKGPPITKIGRRPYYKRTAVKAWLDAGGASETDKAA